MSRIVVASPTGVTSSGNEIEVDLTGFHAGVSGASKNVTIDAEGKWQITMPTWITASKTSGYGRETITITAQANTGSEMRTARVKFRCGTQSKTVVVMQDGVSSTQACGCTIASQFALNEEGLLLASSQSDYQGAYTYIYTVFNNNRLLCSDHNTTGEFRYTLSFSGTYTIVVYSERKDTKQQAFESILFTTTTEAITYNYETDKAYKIEEIRDLTWTDISAAKSYRVSIKAKDGTESFEDATLIKGHSVDLSKYAFKSGKIYNVWVEAYADEDGTSKIARGLWRAYELPYMGVQIETFSEYTTAAGREDRYISWTNDSAIDNYSIEVVDLGINGKIAGKIISSNYNVKATWSPINHPLSKWEVIKGHKYRATIRGFSSDGIQMAEGNFEFGYEWKELQYKLNYEDPTRFFVSELMNNPELENVVVDVLAEHGIGDIANTTGTIVCMIDGYGNDGCSVGGRHSALCVAFRDGVVVFASRNCASTPDDPFNTDCNKSSEKGYTDVPTLLDGKYTLKPTLHGENEYPALKVVAYGTTSGAASVARVYSDEHTQNKKVKQGSYTSPTTSEGINLHYGGSTATTGSYAKPWSTGCQLIDGKGCIDYRVFAGTLGFATKIGTITEDGATYPYADLSVKSVNRSFTATYIVDRKHAYTANNGNNSFRKYMDSKYTGDWYDDWDRTGFCHNNELNTPVLESIMRVDDLPVMDIPETVQESVPTMTFTATAQGTSAVNLSWSKVENATGYTLYVDNKVLATINDGNTTAYTHTGLSASTKYNYRIETVYGNKKPCPKRLWQQQLQQRLRQQVTSNRDGRCRRVWSRRGEWYSCRRSTHRFRW